MDVSFNNSKECKIYEAFVTDSSNRKNRRAFIKHFGNQIADEAIKLHKRIKANNTAADYNRLYGQTENRIEIKKGCKDKDPLIFKTRVTGSYRKFFHHIKDDGHLKLKREWQGEFEDIVNIHVVAVNNHDYNAV